ncbi:MAG TPA: O-antigen ligase family protein [Methylotenera sp.]|nr:O-antigen ligase family protein [Methylotenera sp.]
MVSQTRALSSAVIFIKIEQIIPWLLPILLLSSRSMADFTVLTLGLIFLLKSSLEKSWKWCSEPWFRMSLLFWAYLLLVNAPISIDFADSFLHALFFIRWPLFAAALAYWLLSSVKYQRHLIMALMAVTFFIVFDTWWQYFFDKDLFGHLKIGQDRLTGPFSRPIPGIMLLRIMFIPLFAGLIFQSLKIPLRYILFTVMILSLGLLTIFVTGERMAFLLFVSGTSVISIGLWFEYPKLRIIISSGVFLLLGLLLATALFAPEMSNRTIFSLFLKLQDFASSDYGNVFNAAWYAWKENFILGSGFHTYKMVCEQLGVLAQMGMTCTHPHNLYLQIGAETGLVGLVLFVSLILFIYHAAMKSLIQAGAWYVCSLSFVVLSISFWPLIGGISILNNWVASLVWLGVGWVIAISSQYHRPHL